MTRALLIALLVACGGGKPVAGPVQLAPPRPVSTTWEQLHGPIKVVKVFPEPRPVQPKPPEAKPGEPTPFDTRPVATELAPEVGKPIDRARLRDTLDRALAIPGIAELALRGRQLADGIELLVDVTPQPAVHSITVHDPKGGDVKLDKPITRTPGATLDPDATDLLTAQIADALAEHGFVFANVTWVSKPVANGEVDLDLTVTTGPVVTVASVDVTGVSAAAKGRRDEVMKTIKQSIDAGQPWLIDHIERALLEVTAYYYDRGYVNVAVEPPAQPPAIGGSIPLVIEVREGDRFNLGKLTITGGTPDEIKKYTALAKLKIGGVFSRHDVVEAMNRIRDAIKAAGKPDVDVTPLTDVDAKKKTIALTIEIKPH